MISFVDRLSVQDWLALEKAGSVPLAARFLALGHIVLGGGECGEKQNEARCEAGDGHDDRNGSFCSSIDDSEHENSIGNFDSIV